MEGLQQQHQHRRVPRKPVSNGSSRAVPAESVGLAGGRAGAKWSNPPKPHDYAEIFGGLAAACSIPVLDLPPVSDDAFGGAPAAPPRSSKLDYLDIFGGFRAGDFGASYEELFPVKKEPKPASSNKERFPKEQGTKLQPSLFSGSSVKDQNRGSAASIKTDQSSNCKISQKPSSDSTKIGNQIAKQEAANGSMHFDERFSASAVTFSIDPTQVSSRKNNHSSVPVNNKNENEADNVLEDSSNLLASSRNRMNDATNEVKCHEGPSFAEMSTVEDNPSNEQYHSCSSSDQSSEGEDVTSVQSDINKSVNYKTVDGVAVENHLDETTPFVDGLTVERHLDKTESFNDGVTVESHLDKTTSSSLTSSCATNLQNNFKADQLNINMGFKAPQTATLFEGLHSKASNNQFQSSGEGKHSVADQSVNNDSQSQNINDGTMKEDIKPTLFSNTEVPERDFEMDQKQFEHIDSTFSGRAADGRHLTHSFSSVSTFSGRAVDGRHLSHSFSSVSSPIGERKYDRGNKFLTVVDINLRTVPCKVPPPSRPPPSRPPPKPASTQGQTGAAVHMKRVLSGASETEVVTDTSKSGQLDGGDATSAAAASIAVREAMEQAAAKLKIAKESMERKNNNIQSRKKLGKSHSIQDEEREVDDAPKLANTNEGHHSTVNLSSKNVYAVSHEKTYAAYSEILASESNSDLNQVSCMQDENIGKWEIEEQFVELINSENKIKKVKETSDSNTIKRPKTSVRIVDDKLKESETPTKMEDEYNVKASPGVHMGATNDLLEASKSFGLEESNGNPEETQVLGQVKKADANCSISYSDILPNETEDMMKDKLSSDQKETEVPPNEIEDMMKDKLNPDQKETEVPPNETEDMMKDKLSFDQKETEVPQTGLRPHGFELEVPITGKDLDSCNTGEEWGNSVRDNSCEEVVPKGNFNEEQLDSIHEMHQSDVSEDGINSFETNCKTYTDDMNLGDPEPVEFLPKEVELPSTTRVRKKWNIPKFSEGSILATEKEYDQGGKEPASEPEMATKLDGPKVLNENSETCETNIEESGSREKWEHKSNVIEEISTHRNTDQENVTTEEVNWQHFCEKIIEETEEKPEHSSQKQEAAEVDAESNTVDEEQCRGQGCNKNRTEGYSASSFQDANRCYVVNDVPQSVENEVLKDGEKAHSFKHPGNLESQNLEGAFEKLPEIYRTAQIPEERVLREDLLKRDMEKLEEERERERQRMLEEEREKERERKLEEEREREREREKDRQAVERAIRESRERAERAAVERVTAEARQRALAEAREKAEKASAEALLQAEKASREARLRAERAAVERATAEARERAAERALAEKAAQEAKERLNITSRDWSKREGCVEGIAKVGSKDEPGVKRSISSSDLRESSRGTLRYSYSSNSVSYAPEKVGGNEGESAIRCKARLERHQRTVERAAKALAEKNMRDILAQREQAERNRLAEVLDAEVRRWSSGKEGNLRALLSTLQYILGPDSGWQPIPLTEVITAAAVKKAYRKATLCVHPDKLQQRGASIQQKYICEKVFDLLKEAWNRFNSEER